jgi:hypothetical protein
MAANKAARSYEEVPCITIKTEYKATAKMSKRKLSQGRGSVYKNVDDFVAVKALKLNREQQRARVRPQLIQHQSLAVYRIQ